MKTVVHKSAIPASRLFVARELGGRHFDPSWHAHSEFQLFVVLEGTGTRFIGDSIKTFNPGELILTGPNLPHLWRSDDPYFSKNTSLRSRGIVIYLNDNFLGNNSLDKEELAIVKKLFSKSMRGMEFHGEVRQQVIQLMKKLVSATALNSLIILLQILQLLAGTKDYQYISGATYADPFKQAETDRANLVYEYVISNFRKSISLVEVAALVHLTPTSFSRYFTRHSNKTFSDFVAEVRIRQACKLLVETEQSIESICYDCGFNTLSNFNKQFRALMRDKPSAYRKKFMAL